MAVQLYNGQIVNTLDDYDNQHAEVIILCQPATATVGQQQTANKPCKLRSFLGNSLKHPF